MMDVPLSQLKTAHQELMTRYVALLNEVAHEPWVISRKQAPPKEPNWTKRLPLWLGRPLHWLVKPRPNQTQVKSFPLRVLVHLFVEGHIRSKLKKLAEPHLTLRSQGPAD